jgi:hypothetical protein
VASHLNPALIVISLEEVVPSKHSKAAVKNHYLTSIKTETGELNR